MMPKLKAILKVLEEIAPSGAAEEWDNPGLQVGHLSQEIMKIFISLDPTLKAVREAFKRNAQLLLTHHSLIFRPLSSLNRQIYPGDVIAEALEKRISIVSAHTNLDVVQGGINDILADLFGLQGVEVLEDRNDLGIEGAGLGRIGNLPAPLKLGQMTKKVKEIFGMERVRVVGQKNRRIGRVAVVGGAGGGLVSMASKKGADLLITGDVRHHEALEAERSGLALIDAGHFHTEKAALRPFGDHLKEAFMKRKMEVVVEVYKDEVGPTRYE
ncbi:MAG: Nif3-like dinuclear metal center hexameric protein [Deltaproteobacteria bacterium]|nr:MAG: Nif3-like dinuclear metal center hexameric protein [Deltaproteobacteria bacterium]